MATAAPPPTPPPPPSSGKQPPIRPPPCPQHAAKPFNSNDSHPVQETVPPQEATHDAEDAPAAPLLPVQNEPQSPPTEGQDDSPSDDEEKCHRVPVPETEPAPQTTEQQDEAPSQMDEAGEDQLT